MVSQRSAAARRHAAFGSGRGRARQHASRKSRDRRCYLNGAGATGEWAGRDGLVAGYGEGGWRFNAPAEGLRALRRDNGEAIVFRGGSWESGVVRASEIRIGGKAVVGQRQAAIADPTGGATVDAECRAAISAILGALRVHGLIEL